MTTAITSRANSLHHISLSPDELTLAIIADGGRPYCFRDNFRISVWSTITKSLQSTLHYRGNMNQGNGDETLMKIVFLDNIRVAALWKSTIVVWDINRGVVDYKIDCCSKDKDSVQQFTYLDVCSSKESDLFHVLTKTVDNKKLYIYEYNTMAGKLQRIVKAGKINVDKDTVVAGRINVTEGYIVVFSNISGVRVFNRKDGSKVCKISDSKLNNSSLLLNDGVLALSVASSSSSHAVLVSHDGSVKFLDLKGGHILSLSSSFSPLNCNDKRSELSSRNSVQLVSLKSNMLLLVNNSWILEIVVDEPESRRYLIKNQLSLEVDSGHICGSFLLTHKNNELLVVLSNAHGKFQIQQTPLPSMGFDEKFRIRWCDSNANTDSKMFEIGGKGDLNGEITERRKNSSRSEVDDGSDNMRIKKSRKEVDDQEMTNEDENDDEPTVGERLKWLQEALESDDDNDDDEKELDDANKNDEREMNNDDDHAISPATRPKLRNVTTETLTQLIRQAIQSSDDAMLEIALAVRDQNILQQTILDLSEDEVTILILQVTNRLAINSRRLSHLLPWIQAILLSKRAHDIVCNQIEQLQPLQNLLLERVESYSELLKLQGKLNTML